MPDTSHLESPDSRSDPPDVMTLKAKNTLQRQDGPDGGRVLLLNVNTGKDWVWGGIEAHSEMLAGVLLRRGYSVTIAGWHEGEVRLRSNGLIVPSRRVRVLNSGDLRAVLRIAVLCRREQAGVIIANHGREYWPAALAGLICGVKVIFIRHQLDPIRGTTRLLIDHFVHRVVAVSHAVRQVLLQSGVPDAKVEVIHNAVPLARFSADKVEREAARKELGYSSADIVIGTAAKLHRGKGVYELLKAFCMITERHPGLRLLFVGEGAEEAGLREDAVRCGVKDKVVLAGLRNDMERMYAAMDIFVLASHNEGLPTALLEAMAMSRPVIVTPVGGVPEVIKDGVNGIQVPPGNVESLRVAIERLIANRDLARLIALRGRQTVEEGFSEVVMGRRFEDLLNSIL